MTHLPFVLLGLRTTIREDAGCCPSDVVYGGQLRLPGDLISTDSSVPASSGTTSDFVSSLRSSLRGARPLLPVRRSPALQGHVPAALASVSHVFLRVDSVRQPLTPPYIGPFLVLERGPKTFLIDKSGKKTTVSVDRLKPAFLSPSSDLRSVSPSPQVAFPGPVPRPPASAPVFSASGRRVRPPDRLQL